MPPKGDSAREELPIVGLGLVQYLVKGKSAEICAKGFKEEFRDRKEMKIYHYSFQPCLPRDSQKGAMFGLRSL
jgi:hypothetical protein